MGRNVYGGVGLVTRLLESEMLRLDLQPGSRLPTERELVEASGQSRSAVRSALAALEAEGRIVRQVGRGTFLAPPVPDGDLEVSPAESIATRLAFEPAILPMVVTAARKDDFLEMERCLQGGEESDGFEAFEKWDAALHRSFALATHNTLILRISELIDGARLEPMWGQLKKKSFTPARRSQYEQDHREVVAALMRRDGPLAQDAMRVHLLRVRANLLGD